jgi:HK97 family phage major capsid protein
MTRARDRSGDGWYRITNQSAGPAQILLYDLIGMWGVTAQDFIRDLSAVDGPVDVHINSDGGDCFEAFAIYNALLARSGVTTVVDSIAASAASVIAMAGEQRLMARTSQMMIHDAWAGIDGNADDLQHMMGRLNVMSDQLAGIYADTAGGQPDHWRGLMRDETWFTPQQALDAGLITGIVASSREPAPAGAGASAAAPRGGIRAAAHVPWDPDGDGDDDSTPEGDTDHSHWSADGRQLKSVPGKPVPGQPPAEDPTPNNAAGSALVSWDGSAAMSAASAADDPAAALASICAGRRDGDPKTQAAYALPHHAHPGGPPDPDGTRNALSRLPQTQGLTNEAAAKAHLEAHMKSISPGDAAASSGAAAAPSASRKETRMANDDGTLTIEGRRSRISEIEGECREINASYPASVYPPDVQTRWDRLVIEGREHRQALEHVDARSSDLAQLYAPAAGSHDGPRDGDGRPQGGGQGAPSQRFGAPASRPSHDIYDLVAIRQQARTAEDLPALYRDNALRAIEQHRFPGSKSRETSQANAASLLDTIADDTTGWVARRILATGSPEYARVFGRALAAGRPPTTGRDADILALGESDTGSFAVPFQLDPTVILTTNGAINPLRQISRVERITGKEFDLVTSTGVVVSRLAEFAAATNNAPVLAQPTLQPKRVSGWIPFSVELEGDWTGLQSSMMTLLTDAKDVEESASFTNGPGTGVTAGGVVALQSGGSLVTLTGGASTLSFKDPETLESAMAPRFRAQASYLASKTTFNKYRNLFAAQAGFSTDPWNRPTLSQPRQLWGYDAYEDSDMIITSVTGDKPLLMGDFGHGFLIVDRVGMNMELVPTVFGAAQGNLPTGQRGYFCWWRNNSTVLIPNAFRLAVVG